MMKKIVCLILIVVLLVSLVPLSIAQESTDSMVDDVSEDSSDMVDDSMESNDLSQEIEELEEYVNNDEDLKLETELEFEEVSVGWFGALFNRVKNAERRIQQAEQRLSELNDLVESGEVDEATLERARERYEKALEKAQSTSERLKERNDEDSMRVLKTVLRHNLRSKEVSDMLLEKTENLPVQARERVRANIERYEERRAEFESKFEDVEGDAEVERLHRLRFKNAVRQTLHRLELIDSHLNRLEEQGHDVSDIRIRVSDTISRLKESVESAENLEDLRELRLTLEEANEFIREIKSKLSNLGEDVDKEVLKEFRTDVREKYEEVLRSVLKRLEGQDVEHARARKAIETILESRDGELRQKLRDVREVERKDMKMRVDKRLERRSGMRDGEDERREVRTREEVRNEDGTRTKTETRIREKDGEVEVETREEVREDNSGSGSSDEK